MRRLRSSYELHSPRLSAGFSREAFRQNDDSVIITISDKGIGIPDVEAARAPLYTTDTTGERSGMGFAIMEGLMDACRVRSKVGFGTVVTMKIRLGAVVCKSST